MIKLLWIEVWLMTECNYLTTLRTEGTDTKTKKNMQHTLTHTHVLSLSLTHTLSLSLTHTHTQTHTDSDTSTELQGEGMRSRIPGQMAGSHPVGPAIRALPERKRRTETVSSAPLTHTQTHTNTHRRKICFYNKSTAFGP